MFYRILYKPVRTVLKNSQLEKMTKCVTENCMEDFFIVALHAQGQYID